MWRQPPQLSAERSDAKASADQTLLSVAFDVDFDPGRTLIRRGCPIFRVFCERWEPRTPAAPFLKLMSPLQVWNGHSCSLLATSGPIPLILYRLSKCRLRLHQTPKCPASA